MNECMYRNCDKDVGHEHKKGRKKLFCCDSHQQMEGYYRNKENRSSLEYKIKQIVESMLDERLAQ